MKHLPLLLLPLLLLSGCVTLPANSPPPAVKPTVAQIAPFVTQLAQTGVPLILNKNPKYAPIISSVATAIPAAFAAGNLDATSISATIAIIGQKNGLTSEEDGIISAALLDAVTWYQATYSAGVVNATDPNVKTLLLAFATGLNNGVITWSNSQLKP